MLRSVEINVRPKAEVFVLPDEALAALFCEWDPSHVEIGMVRFHQNPREVSDGWIIGQVEADYLMLDRASGEVLALDLADPHHVLWNCARDGAGFLAALAVAAEYLAACISNDNLAGSNTQQDAFARAVALAGGVRYSNFYKMLLLFD